MKQKDTSISRRISFLVIGFGFIVICITFFFMILFANRKGNEADTSQRINFLDSSANAFDDIIKQYHELCIQITSYPSIRNYVITNYHDPNAGNADIKALFAIAKNQHAYLRNIWLYDVRSGYVIDDFYNEQVVAQSVYSTVTENYLSGSIPLEKLHYNGWFTNLFWYDDQLYIAREFPVIGDSKLGILFIRINVDYVFRNQVMRGSDNNNLIVFDGDKLVLPLTGADNISENVFRQIISSGSNYAAKQSLKYIIVSSALTGWLYCGVFPEYNIVSSDNILLFSALLLVILIAALFFSKLIYDIVVIPVQKLAQSSRDMFSISDKNEISAISKSLSRYSESIKTYDSTISTISVQMSEQFFSDLLNGTPMHVNYIRTALRLLSSPLDLAGSFWIILIHFSEAIDNGRLEQFAVLIEKSIKKHNIDYLKYHIHTFEDRIAVILELSVNISLDTTTAYRSYIFSHVVNALASLEVKLDVGNGTIVYSLGSISDSYHSAEKDLLSLSNLHCDNPESIPQLPQAESDSSDKQFRLLADQLFDLVDNNRLWQALENLEVQVDLYLSSSESSSVFFSNCQKLQSALLKKAADADISPEIFLEDGKDPFAINESMPTSQIYDNTLAQARACLKARQRKNRMNNHHLVQTAKLYIDQHYTESDLSLGTLAEAVNTSPGYLSKMFKSNEEISFVEYLNNLRVAHAKDLLSHTDIKVKDIPQSVGFYSEQNFFRVFKRITHTTPNQYRSMQNKNH